MYRRQIEVIGKESQELLSKKSVLIVGAGGLGNIIATSVSCIGLRRIYIIDFDEIEIHNIHRQFWFYENDCGESKSIMLSKKLDQRCKDTEIIGINKKFDSSLKLDVDLIFDASDNFEVRREIDKFAKIHSIPWIYASVEEFRGQVGVFKNTSFEIFATKEHNVKGQIPMMVNLIGSIASMLGLKVLIANQKEVLYFVDFKEDLEVKKFYI